MFIHVPLSSSCLVYFFIRPQLDKKNVLEQYDLLALTIDEVIDKGYTINIHSLFINLCLGSLSKLKVKN